MKLIYKNKEITVFVTKNKTIMKNNFQKLRYAIIIENCNSYSSIASKQKIDIALTDNNLNIISYKYKMHENTIFSNSEATKTVLLPLNIFPDLKKSRKFTIKKDL